MIGVGTLNLSHKARVYINQVLDSGRLSYGPFTQKFERDFAAVHQSRFGIMTSSGTCCLQIALAALKHKYGWSDGDEVIVPAVTFIATSNIVIQNNMKPVFVDVDPVFYELNPAKIEKAITKKTKCIIPVHLFGCPCDMDPIIDLAKKYNLKIIEDSCETMFVKYKNRSVGSLGEIGCFSTYVAHILTTGVGGICTTNSPDLAVSLRSIMNHGRDSIYISIDDDNNKTDKELELIIQKRFSFVQMGYSYRVTEFEGALGVAEFEHYEEMMGKRFSNGRYFMDKLKPFSDKMQLPTIRPDSGHAFMMFPIVMRDEPKTEMVNFLEKNGIETREMLPLINQPFYKELFKIKEDDYPVAKWINASGFYIASHHGLTEIEREYIVETFGNFFAKHTVKKDDVALIVLSKVITSPELLDIQQYLEALPLEMFREFYLVEASGNQLIKSEFRKKNFEIIEDSPGKGAAIQKIIKKCQCENIIIMGIDGSDNPNDLDKILIKLKEGHDLVIASRFLPGGRRYTTEFLRYRSIGNRFFTFLLNITFGNKNTTDSVNTYRGIRRSSFDKIKVTDNQDNIMFEMTLKALESNLSVFEIPTAERKPIIRKIARKSFTNALDFAWILFKYYLNPKTEGKRKKTDKI